jgi:hypothetical protein
MFELWCLRFEVSRIETYKDIIRRGFEFAKFFGEISLVFLWVMAVKLIGCNYNELCEHLGAAIAGGCAGF